MIINLKSQTDLAGFYIVYEGSTNLEKPGWYGVSHLGEHLVCKLFDGLREDFQKYSIDWNAYTSNNEIVFYFTGLEECLAKYRHKIIELMQDFTITKEQFENEKKIVLQEYSDYFSDQTEAHSLNLSRKMFRNFDPIGTREDLEALRWIDFLNFYELQYSSPTKIINVSPTTKFEAGNIEFNRQKMDKRYEQGPFDDVKLEKMFDYGDKESIFIISPLIEEDFPYVMFVNQMLSSGLSSPLYREIREKRGLVYYIRMSISRMNNQGVNGITTQTTSNNVDELKEAINYVFNNPEEFLTKDRLETIRESTLVRLKKEKITRFANVSRWIQPKEWSMYDIVKTINMDKVMETFETHFNIDDYYFSSDKDFLKK